MKTKILYSALTAFLLSSPNTGKAFIIECSGAFHMSVLAPNQVVSGPANKKSASADKLMMSTVVQKDRTWHTNNVMPIAVAKTVGVGGHISSGYRHSAMATVLRSFGLASRSGIPRVPVKRFSLFRNKPAAYIPRVPVTESGYALIVPNHPKAIPISNSAENSQPHTAQAEHRYTMTIPHHPNAIPASHVISEKSHPYIASAEHRYSMAIPGHPKATPTSHLISESRRPYAEQPERRYTMAMPGHPKSIPASHLIAESRHTYVAQPVHKYTIAIPDHPKTIPASHITSESNHGYIAQIEWKSNFARRLRGVRVEFAHTANNSNAFSYGKTLLSRPSMRISQAVPMNWNDIITEITCGRQVKLVNNSTSNRVLAMTATNAKLKKTATGFKVTRQLITSEKIFGSAYTSSAARRSALILARKNWINSLSPAKATYTNKISGQEVTAFNNKLQDATSVHEICGLNTSMSPEMLIWPAVITIEGGHGPPGYRGIWGPATPFFSAP